jgi:hypothetical protein
MKMRIPLIAALAVIVSLAACSDMPSAYSPDELNLKAASPNTSVSGSFEIVEEGGTVVTPRTLPVGGAGSCYTNDAGIGVWVQPGTGAHNVGHSQCNDIETTEGSTVAVSFDVVANFVQPPSGNVQLNFTTCGYTEDEDGNWIQDCDASRYVHYNKRHDARDGAGTLMGFGDDGSMWLIHLGQASGDGIDGLASDVRELTFLAEKVGSDVTWEGAKLTW